MLYACDFVCAFGLVKMRQKNQEPSWIYLEKKMMINDNDELHLINKPTDRMTSQTTVSQGQPYITLFAVVQFACQLALHISCTVQRDKHNNSFFKYLHLLAERFLPSLSAVVFYESLARQLSFLSNVF